MEADLSPVNCVVSELPLQPGEKDSRTAAVIPVEFAWLNTELGYALWAPGTKLRPQKYPRNQ